MKSITHMYIYIYVHVYMYMDFRIYFKVYALIDVFKLIVPCLNMCAVVSMHAQSTFLNHWLHHWLLPLEPWEEMVKTCRTGSGYV